MRTGVHTNDPTATITPVITATLDVPGATLHYQVRGTGPMMLMICRGISDADLLAHLAQRLADQFTIGTYDRRGNSRSPPAGPPVPQRIEVHADDADRWSELIEGFLDSTGRRAGPAMVIFGAAMGMSDDAGGDRDPEDGGDRADSGARGDPGHAGALHRRSWR